MKNKPQTSQTKLNFGYPTPVTRIKRSPFRWPLLEVLLIVLFLLSLQERAWSRLWSQQVESSLDQLSTITSENQLILSRLSDFYDKERFELTDLVQPEREYIINPSITRK